jgi:hypothetical protein
MNAVDFFANACMHSYFGETFNAQQFITQSDWRHAEALAHRQGFEQDSHQPGLYISQRENTALTLRWLTHADFESWHLLFQTCFKHTMSLEQWHWKYRDAQRVGIGAFHGNQLIAFYGGMPRKLLWQGQHMSGIQIGDVMVHPNFRASLRRTGPFQMVASTFLEQNLSEGGFYDLGFGFPNQRAFQVAQRLGLYRAVDEVVQISWEATRNSFSPWFYLIQGDAQTFLPSLDRIWMQMQTDFHQSLLGTRDKAYLQERYINGSHASYEWIGLRSRLTRQIVCIAICRVRPEGLEILDLLGSKQRFAAMLKLIRGSAQAQVSRTIFMWVTQSHQHIFANTQERITPIDICVPTNAWKPRSAPQPPANSWWLTGGDADFR